MWDSPRQGCNFVGLERPEVKPVERQESLCEAVHCHLNLTTGKVVSLDQTAKEPSKTFNFSFG